jgi:hypothetical protein
LRGRDGGWSEVGNESELVDGGGYGNKLGYWV